jgi:hypothetical protein
MRNFDFYEFAALLAPGAVALVVLGATVPATRSLIFNLQIGDFGLFVLLAYVCGHLAQAVGGFLESAWWKARGGIPTDWPRRDSRLLSSSQRLRLIAGLRKRGLIDERSELHEITEADWYAITRQVYAVVQKADRSTRVDIFNGNYGLSRGLAAAFLVLAAFLTVRVVFDGDYPQALLLVCACLLLFLYRMDRFGQHYARELYIQFIETD